jgi:hypothetical protein
MSKEQEVFILADEALLSVVEQIQTSQWDQKVTEPLANGKDVTLHELIDYHAYDESWVPDTLAGKTIAEVGDTYAGDLLGDDPIATYTKLVRAVVSTVKALPESELDKIVHLTYGDYSAREYLKHITCFRGFRAYTIAKYIGVDSTLPSALVQGMWDEFQPEIEQWRALGVFGPPVAVPTDADLQAKLLGLTGFLQQ